MPVRPGQRPEGADRCRSARDLALRTRAFGPGPFGPADHVPAIRQQIDLAADHLQTQHDEVFFPDFRSSHDVPQPDDVPLERACLLGCCVLTGAGAALNTAAVQPGMSVAVIGCGGVGLAAVQGARIAGAEMILAVDIDPTKLELAQELGATHAVDGRADVPKQVRKIARLGVHAAIEAIGRTETIETAWSILRPGGVAVVVGMPASRELAQIRVGGFFQEKRLAGCVYGSANAHRDIPRLFEHVQRGELRLYPLVSHELPLDAAQDALDDLARGAGARHVLVMESAV